jgi:thiamine kinase-like enzyme
MSISAIVEQLARLQAPYSEHKWHGWHIRPIASGNNLLFRTTRDDQDWAVKFMIRDQRNRAQHEFSALTMLEHQGALIGPRPLYLDLDSYQHAVVVQTWVDGTALLEPPADDSTWSQILQVYALVHTLEPVDEQQGVVNFVPADQTIAAIQTFARDIPPSPYAQALADLNQMLDQIRLPNVRASQCWCHGDPNIRNILMTATGVQLVDWEYSGTGDPAQEIANLMTHPFARAISDERRLWVVERYANISGEIDMLLRIRIQYALRLAWWCVRLVYGRYVLLQRPSQRLVGSRAEEEISTVENIEHYFSRTQYQLATFSRRP